MGREKGSPNPGSRCKPGAGLEGIRHSFRKGLSAVIPSDPPPLQKDAGKEENPGRKGKRTNILHALTSKRAKKTELQSNAERSAEDEKAIRTGVDESRA